MEIRPPLWSSRLEFLTTDPQVLDSSGSGTGLLSLVKINEELLERKSSGCGPEK
jgi:hypothetical protein